MYLGGMLFQSYIAEIVLRKSVSIVSPSICHEVMRLEAIILVFWMLNFKTAFSVSSFTLTKKLFSSSSLSAIRVVLSAYLRLLKFLPAVLTPACALSFPAFYIMYSAYNKLNKQGDNIQPWCAPFPVCIKFVQNLYTILYKSVVPFPVLTLFLDGYTDFSGDRESCLVLLSP